MKAWETWQRGHRSASRNLRITATELECWRTLISDYVRLLMLVHSHFYATSQSVSSISLDLDLIEQSIHDLLTVRTVDCVNRMAQEGLQCYEVS